MHDLHHAVGLWNGVEKRRKSNSRHKGCGMDGADNEVVASLDFREKGRRVAFVTEGSYMGCRFTFAYDEDDVVDFGITESSRGE